MALDVVQVEGCYVSSSLPKALFIPSPSVRLKNRENVNSLYYKSKRKRPEISPRGIISYEKECPPVAGRQHLSIQTDQYLEELCDAIEETDAATETDPTYDRSPSPLFIPAKTGVDVATQICSGELFDFDEEVEPIIEALVAQTIEQAVVEIMAEEEMATLSDKQAEYEVKRNVEVAELRRLEEEERRLLEEKQQRLKEQEEAIQLEDEVAQKIVACIFSQNYLTELVPQVYQKLETEGYFEAEDIELAEVEENFWPWLLNEVDTEIATLEASCHLLDSLIQDSVDQVAETSVIHPAPEMEGQSVEVSEISHETIDLPA